MPLRCLDPDSSGSIHAFDLSDDAWDQLVAENRRRRHLRMPCCTVEVVLKTSRRGTRFFAHKAAGDCATAPETEAHLRLKQLAVEVARAHGWDAETEASGVSTDGAAWRADVLARKGGARIAVEVQWSRQTPEETLRRQDRYAASGVRCLWVFRHAGFPCSGELPAARLDGSPEKGFLAVVHRSAGGTEQVLPMPEFLNAAFERRFRFGWQRDTAATMSIFAGPIFCWACGAETSIVSGLEIASGPHLFRLSVPDLTTHTHLFHDVLPLVEARRDIGRIKMRHSRTQGRSYLSNGCAHCDALVGQFHECEARTEETKIGEVEIQFGDDWIGVIEATGDEEPAWGVYAPS